ncbi:O-antigen ligase family protein [Patescibacteria group bacterium AH-259-L07]|nr:O-antigen ligase family protein [Patescibacteria group bacterium AH-259-L07]
MKKQNHTPFIDVILEAIWLAIIFFIPLYFDRNIYNVFEIPKNILFQGLVEILLFVFLVKLVLYTKPVIDPVRDKKLLVSATFKKWISNGVEVIKKRIKYFIPAIVFIAVLGISTLLSSVPWFSFWGSWERRMGYLAWLHFFVFACILFINIKNKKRVYRILLAVVFSSVFVALYGFIQASGFDPFSWTEDPFKVKRIFSAVGQANFLGSWLLLVIPIAIYGIRKKHIAIKAFSSILLVFLVWALILTKSRGAWVGLIALIVFMSIVYLWRLKRVLVIIPIVCFVALVGFVIFLNSADIDSTTLKSPFMGRLASFTDLEEAGNYRLMHWKASLDLIKKRPVIGYGLGVQRFNFPKYYQPEFAVYEKPNIYLDYAHNDILDILLAAGFIGLFAYLFLIGSVFWHGLRYFLRRQKNGVLVLLLLSGLFAYLVSILFSFHVMSTLVYFWVFIVLVIVMAKNLIKSDWDFTAHVRASGELTPQKSLSILLLLVFLLTSLWYFNARLYISGSYLLDARRAKAYGNWQEVIIDHEQAVRFSPNDPYFRQEYALSLYQASFLIPSDGMTPSSLSFRAEREMTEETRELFQEQKQKLDILNTGIAQIQSIPDTIQPIEALIWLPWLKAEKANVTKKEIDFISAEKAYEAVADFSPQTALIYNQWCNLKIYKGNDEEARDMCEYALSLYPDLNHPHLNQKHRQDLIEEMIPVYLNLAKVYQQLDDVDTAIDRAEKSVYLITSAFSLPYPDTLRQGYTILSLLYGEKGDEEQVEFYKNLTSSEP